MTVNKASDWLIHNLDTVMSNIRLGDYSTIFTEPEENNCFSIIAQVIIRANAFSFFFSSEISKIGR